MQINSPRSYNADNSGPSYTASKPFFEDKKFDSAIYKNFDPYSWDAMMRLFK
jgi:hypothetical protein